MSKHAEQPANTVLVTGAAGFIGSHLCERLARMGKTVVGVDNFDPYYSRYEKEANVKVMRAAGADFRETDVRNYGDIASIIDVSRPDVVVHLAAKAGVRNSIRFPRQYFETNLIGTQNVLDSCRSLGIERLALASTSSVYGNTKEIPFHETDPCDAPLHPYAASKRSTEMLAHAYSRLYDLQITVLRFFTVYGERGRPDMMPRLLMDSATSGREVPLFEGEMERDWTHISDIVEGLARAVDRPLGFEILNLGRGKPESLANFIETLENVSGKQVNLVPTPRPSSEMLTTYASNEKIGDLLDFTPQKSVREGIELMWDWWLEHLAETSS